MYLGFEKKANDNNTTTHKYDTQIMSLFKKKKNIQIATTEMLTSKSVKIPFQYDYIEFHQVKNV